MKEQTHRCDDRIVDIYQRYVRPMVHGESSGRVWGQAERVYFNVYKLHLQTHQKSRTNTQTQQMLHLCKYD